MTPKRLPRFCVWLAAVGLTFQAGCAARPAAEPEAVESQEQPITRTFQVRPMFADEVSNLRYDAPVRNDTDKRVRFTQVRQSCSCAGGTKLAKMELAPGEETVLHFDIDLSMRKGPQRFVCNLVEAGGAEWTYQLETTLYERAQFAGAGAVHFGMLDPKAEEAREAQLFLHAMSREHLPQRVSFRTNGQHLRVESGLTTEEELPDGIVLRKLRLKLSLQTPEVPGPGGATVFADLEPQNTKLPLQMGVTWNVRSFYSVAPAQAYFGTVDPVSAESVERRVVIRRTDGQPLSIKAVKVPSPCVSWSEESTTGDSARTLILTLNPKELRGPVAGDVLVETDDAVQPWVKVPVAAWTRASK